MGGLAIGSFVAGRLADRVTAPLRWFAVAELLIGVTALCTPWLLDALEVLYRQVYSSVSDDAGVLTAVRFAGSLAALLVPTTLMGASVPLVIRASVRRTADLGPRAAALYVANATGALAGALITGYYLVTQLGITNSLRRSFRQAPSRCCRRCCSWARRFRSACIAGLLDAAIPVRTLAIAWAGSIWSRLTFDGPRIVGQETLVQRMGRIRDVRQGPDGFIYLVTDDRDGKPTPILRMEPVARAPVN